MPVLTRNQRKNSSVATKVIRECVAIAPSDNMEVDIYMVNCRTFISNMIDTLTQYNALTKPTDKIKHILNMYKYIDANMTMIVYSKRQDINLLSFVALAFTKIYEFLECLKTINVRQSVKDRAIRELMAARQRLVPTIKHVRNLLPRNSHTILAVKLIEEMDTKNMPTIAVLRRSPRNIPRVNYAGMC